MTPQAHSVLKHLETGKSITALEAIGVYGCFRLAARIGEIRDEGHAVITEYKKDFKGKQYGRYTLGKFFTPSITHERSEVS